MIFFGCRSADGKVAFHKSVFRLTLLGRTGPWVSQRRKDGSGMLLRNTCYFVTVESGGGPEWVKS